MSEIPPSHPRFHSLMMRERLVEGLHAGLCTETGLIAHGRGEALDYLLGERTHPFAVHAIEAASAAITLANHPMLSVNGNVASLAAAEMAELAKEFPRIGIEVNLFHGSSERSRKIADRLRSFGAPTVLEAAGPDSMVLATIQHNRKYMHPDGIGKADVVLVALEDGDRCQALVESGRRVIAIDLNPLSRTAKLAHFSIVDELTRCVPRLHVQLRADRTLPSEVLKQRLHGYDNCRILSQAEQVLRQGNVASK